MITIKEGDFIEIEYTGRIKNNNKVFDTTLENVAKKEGIHSKGATYGSRIICIGNYHILKGLDDNLKGKEIGKEYTFDIDMKDAFGKKNAKLIKTVPSSLFKKQKMNPFPGLQINADGMMGVVRSVAGGRVLVDFNHPLAGRELVYYVNVIKKVDDEKEQISSILMVELGLKKDMYSLEYKDGAVEIKTKIKIPDEIQKVFADRVKKLVKGLKKLSIVEEKKK
jgi:FKBP-type peptidyl-prolyl cis-trans isomerase 2